MGTKMFGRAARTRGRERTARRGALKGSFPLLAGQMPSGAECEHQRDNANPRNAKVNARLQSFKYFSGFALEMTARRRSQWWTTCRYSSARVGIWSFLRGARGVCDEIALERTGPRQPGSVRNSHRSGVRQKDLHTCAVRTHRADMRRGGGEVSASDFRGGVLLLDLIGVCLVYAIIYRTNGPVQPLCAGRGRGRWAAGRAGRGAGPGGWREPGVAV